MKFPDDLFEKLRPQIEHALAAMRELEGGAIANPTENRMVGHYWLRNPALGPTPEIRAEIEDTIRRINVFAKDVHAGKITAENGTRFKHVLLIGIGGSALGPQFVSAALGSPDDPMDIFFFDNTDPEGFDRVFDRIGEGLPQTLVVVVSKSGGTKETRNGMLEAEAKFAANGLQFARHVVQNSCLIGRRTSYVNNCKANCAAKPASLSVRPVAPPESMPLLDFPIFTKIF